MNRLPFWSWRWNFNCLHHCCIIPISVSIDLRKKLLSMTSNLHSSLCANMFFDFSPGSAV
uniref:Uncharacterized protein n=1 Tax=Medicago truncatula TaxID=3880 RepID=I3SMK3_MEDTR|nr:unknown [Medicago truncatula]